MSAADLLFDLTLGGEVIRLGRELHGHVGDAAAVDVEHLRLRRRVARQLVDERHLERRPAPLDGLEAPFPVGVRADVQHAGDGELGDPDARARDRRLERVGRRRRLREIEAEVEHGAADGDQLQPAAARRLSVRDGQLARIHLRDRVVCAGFVGRSGAVASDVGQRQDRDREQQRQRLRHDWPPGRWRGGLKPTPGAGSGPVEERAAPITTLR